MNPSSSSHYTFGDNDLAAARLERLAAAYAPSSAAFLRESLSRPVRRALDLGSGLGLTTALLREVTMAPFVVGYERSPRYLELAKSRFPGLTFRAVDVLLPPYPDADLDLIYSRFLLTHLPDPLLVVSSCLERLSPNGQLLLEEVSNLSASLPVLQKYYVMVGEMQAHYGQELYVGRRLTTLVNASSSAQGIARSTPIELPAQVMAQLHAMNIATWKRDPFMLEAYGLKALEAEEVALSGIAHSAEQLPAVICEMTQVVLTRLE